MFAFAAAELLYDFKLDFFGQNYGAKNNEMNFKDNENVAFSRRNNLTLITFLKSFDFTVKPFENTKSYRKM